MTFDPNKTMVPTKHRVKHAIGLTEMPSERWQQTAQKTVLGTLFVVLGVVGAAKFQWSVWVVIGLVGFGAHTMSSQIIGGSIKNFIPLVKAFADAIRGKDAAP